MISMERRTFLSSVGAAIAAASAGCMDAVGDDELRFEAGQAYVSESVADETGYDLRETDQVEFERTVEAGDRSRTVEAVSHYAHYERSVDLGGEEHPAATVSVLTTPKVEILGQSVNPVATLDTEEVAERIQDRYERVETLEPVGESTIEMLGTETTLTQFEGEVELEEGQTVDVHLHVTDAVESGDDLVIVLGGYPERLPDEEEPMRTAIEGVDHDEAS